MNRQDVEKQEDADYRQHPCTLHIPLLRNRIGIDKSNEAESQAADCIDGKAKVLGLVASTRRERYETNGSHQHKRNTGL